MSKKHEEFPLISIDSIEYFPQLIEIPQPPSTLSMRGSLERIIDTVLLAVVGSRKFSLYGKEVCEKLIAGLEGYDITIVSGLALGIDGIAHRAALDAGLATIAFPGSGLAWEALYPPTHQQLALDILRSGGALLSEFDTTVSGAYWAFPQRNRLIAGISLMTLIIEAEEKSGTLITARLATEYNKTVGAVPGSITSKTSHGANELLRLGAVPITSTRDILRELGFEEKQTVKKVSEIILNEQEERIIEYLTSPQLKETIITELALDPIEASITFSTLEIKGCIRETLGLLERTQ